MKNTLVIADKYKDKRNEYYKTYYSKPHVRRRVIEYNKKWEKNCIQEWEGFIPIESNCQVCGKKIFFNRKKTNDSIHFDHKDDKEKHIKEKSPNQWLRKHRFNDNHASIWHDCNWGHLCRRCNSALPTKDRMEWVKNVVKYVFGKQAEINLDWRNE